MPPLPPSRKYIQSIRDSSRSLREKARIMITADAIERLLLSPAFITSFKRVSTYHGLNLPLNFSSRLDELNLLSILSLLNFASGYRVQLHQEVARGAWDSIRAFVFSLYLSSSVDGGNFLSAKGMAAIDATKVAELLGVNVHIERAHDTIPGLTVGQLGGPMHELVKLITTVMNETGTVLVNLGYPNLGAFVAEALKEGAKAKSSTEELDIVLERLVRAIPAFQDMAEVDGQPVYCFKKALFLIHAIVLRFGSLTPPPFPIPSTAQSPIFTDNVLPSMLVHLGVIDLSASPTLSRLFPSAGSPENLKVLLEAWNGPETAPKVVPKEGPILTSDQAYVLRAAAVDACELIIKVAGSLPAESLPDDGSLDWIKQITLPELDLWIWAVAKDRPDYRRLERFVLKNTVFF
ncbi:putative potential Queuosine, Q, salvage protein family protein [Lyophyllum shimeji]|uniref:Queuosine 5'-phosphate N-glycosylase/hydrolase n=1 Tax=Lyophyllum shimeji TaxID=47721 RepID=A0A9P3UMY0_LYOSH|nr:putative potential Queuosine, Q, salvage protein family protein [Lyophyllum shimeji]